MRELWPTGWMHNRVRMIVASLLTKNLRQPWLEGARWFWDTLVDADLPNNTLGWQWTAGCGADAAPYFRIFNPMLQTERFDPDRAYLRRWVPELAALPDAWIHRPWEAPAGGAGRGRRRARPRLPAARSSISATAARRRSPPTPHQGTRRPAAARAESAPAAGRERGRHARAALSPRYLHTSCSASAACRRVGRPRRPCRRPVVEQGYPLRKVGAGELRWLGLAIYDASLWTSSGRYSGLRRRARPWR